MLCVDHYILQILNSCGQKMLSLHWMILHYYSTTQQAVKLSLSAPHHMPTPHGASWSSRDPHLLMIHIIHLASSWLSCTSSVCIKSTQVNTFVPKSIVDVDGIFMRTQ